MENEFMFYNILNPIMLKFHLKDGNYIYYVDIYDINYMM